MRSSTSSSEGRPARRAVWRLLLALCAVLLALEAGARWLAPLVNRNLRRFERECAGSMAVGKGLRPDQSGVLLLGNSLTLTDVDMELLAGELGPSNRLARWAIDDTNYLDWYFGLRRAVRNGARPKLILLGGRSSHFLAGHVRDRFFAHYILDWRDLPEAAARTGADATGVSNLGLAQASAFYGSRDEIFKRCLTALVPSFPKLGRQMAAGAKRAAAPAALPAAVLSERFKELQQLASRCGARLVLWVPPAPGPDPGAALLSQAAEREGIPVILPGGQEAWAKEDFSDGFHMTPEAARRFTAWFARELKGRLKPEPEGGVAAEARPPAPAG